MSFFPIIELVDRYAIARLRFDRTQANQEELDFYNTQIANIDITKITKELDELFAVHQSIWNLEAELKSGVEDQLSLEEIGRRAIEIRNWNNKRIRIKNLIADKLGSNIKEIKRDHLSQ
jgi:hypothetical protein